MCRCAVNAESTPQAFIAEAKGSLCPQEGRNLFPHCHHALASTLDVDETRHAVSLLLGGPTRGYKKCRLLKTL